MTQTGDNLRARLFPGRESQYADSMIAAVEDQLDTDEEVEYRIPSTDSLTLEDGDETEKIPVAADGQSLAVVTDRQLLFAVETPNGESIIDVPYTDLKAIEVKDGLLGTALAVSVWAVGTYNFSPSETEPLERAAEFADRISDCWQQVVAALEQVDEQAEEIQESLESGRLGAAEEALAVAERNLDRARSKAETDGFGASDAMGARIEAREKALDRARIEGRLDRVDTLLREARHQTDSRAYTGAYKSYQRAREHLETALVIDVEWDFGRCFEIQEQIDTLETRVENLRVRPMALAHQAKERADGTEKIDVKVQALREAFEHYRDALTAGWGIDSDFSSRADLREHIESVVGELIETRRQFATELTEDGDRYRAAGDESMAQERYKMASNQLDAAETLAKQFRAGDRAAIQEQQGDVSTRRIVAA